MATLTPERGAEAASGLRLLAYTHCAAIVSDFELQAVRPPCYLLRARKRCVTPVSANGVVHKHVEQSTRRCWHADLAVERGAVQTCAICPCKPGALGAASRNIAAREWFNNGHGRGRPPAVTHGLDRIESDGGGGSGLLSPSRKNLSTPSPCPSRAYTSSTLAGLCVARRRDRTEPCVRDSDEKARRRQVAAAPAVALSTGSPRERSPC
jgi:hypothetical protein